MTKFDPTPEQQRALELFLAGGDLAIEAGAGTGKTSTLVLLAEAAPKKRVQYVAFNRAIVEDVKAKAPRNVRANTAHQLAMREVGNRFRHRLNSPRMKSMELASRLRTEEIAVEFEGQRKVLSRSFLAGQVMRSVVKFCQTADAEIGATHVPFIHGIDNDVAEGTARRFPNNRFVAESLVPVLRRAWADLTKVDGQLPYGHHAYLKLWQLGSPRIGADVILFDEAQDASAVMQAVVMEQTHAQIVWVGDSQQEIYAWAGAVNALSKVRVDNRTFLTQSFRFGPAVADTANRVLAAIPGAELRLSGFDQIDSKVEPVEKPAAILCRTNATAVSTVLNALRDGGRPFLVGGGSEVIAFARAAERLKRGETADHPELACFDTWLEVQSYVESDPQGGDLRLMVDLIDEFGADVIIEALNGMGDERDADLVVSTAHKAKGREWASVRLAADFGTDLSAEELRLLYVSVTRARLVLDIEDVEWFRLGGAQTPPAAPATVDPPVPPAAPSPALSAPPEYSPGHARLAAAADFSGGSIEGVAVDSEDDGFHLVLSTDEGTYRFRLPFEAGMEIHAALAPLREHHATGEDERRIYEGAKLAGMVPPHHLADRDELPNELRGRRASFPGFVPFGGGLV